MRGSSLCEVGGAGSVGVCGSSLCEVGGAGFVGVRGNSLCEAKGAGSPERCLREVGGA